MNKQEIERINRHIENQLDKLSRSENKVKSMFKKIRLRGEQIALLDFQIWFIKSYGSDGAK